MRSTRCFNSSSATITREARVIVTTCKPGRWDDELPYRVKASYRSRDGEEHRVRVRYWLNWLEIQASGTVRTYPRARERRRTARNPVQKPSGSGRPSARLSAALRRQAVEQ